jgi:hypothetical protein
MLTASDETWDAAIAADPEGPTRGFRKRPLKYREQLEQIFSETTATGQFVLGPDDESPVQTAQSSSERDSTPSSSVPTKRQAVAPSFRRAKRGRLEEKLEEISSSFEAMKDRYLQSKTPEDAIKLLNSEVGRDLSPHSYRVAVRIVSKQPGVYCTLLDSQRQAWLEAEMEEQL